MLIIYIILYNTTAMSYLKMISISDHNKAGDHHILKALLENCNRGLGTLYGPPGLHILSALVHKEFMKAFKLLHI
jgi:hypothetical protein